ncbi:MAG: Unknown protein [uncultured Sulfurovum sp.]|uniref:Tat (Twin-arginine translocation) pathway signal sequence domain protein n=1 Tax=uncultured Sulfurovum sp. TaxID=269237 RepID=A0A6S6SRN6_9BACT|nr:MAG: Unknown protein [uncultured Sulfurovum sp.]
MQKNKLSRREFLKNIGLTGAVLPFLGNIAWAEEEAIPIKRLILIEHPDGINPDYWFPTGSETDFSLPAMTEPFNSVKEDCVFLEGINLGGGLAGHGAYAGLWRGSSQGISIDQYFAEKWRGETAVTSLVHKASDIYSGTRSLAYDSFGVLIPALVNPLSILDKIYTNEDIEAKAFNDVAESKRRLATMKADLNDLKQGEMRDNALFESHDKALSDMLDVLNARTEELIAVNMDEWKDDFEARATAGGLTSREESRWRNAILADNSAFELMSGLHEDAIVAALKYDRTRVINYSYGTDTWDFYLACDDQNAYPYHNAGHEMGIGHIETRKVTSKRVANLIKTLKETNDIYGQPLLDSTLVVYACEIGHAANHTNKNAPFILAGAGLEGGRYLKYNGVLWNKVLVSIANILGDDLTSFGTTDPDGGALPNLV